MSEHWQERLKERQQPQLEADHLWSRIESLAKTSMPVRRFDAHLRSGRILAAVVAFALFVPVVVFAWSAFRSSHAEHRPSTPLKPRPAAHGGIVRVQILPIPEGPTSPVFTVDAPPNDKWIRPLGMIEPYIPQPLPAPVVQSDDCSFGGDLVITFGDHSQVTYGPCERPDPIDRLWAALVYATDRRCAPHCGPDGEPPPQLAESTPSPGISAWPASLEEKALTFASLNQTVRFLRLHMNIPIRLPAGMPADVRLDPRTSLFLTTRNGRRAAQLSLVFGPRREPDHLILEFGAAELDGCAPEASVSVRIGGAPGRLRIAAGGTWTDLIWPATLAHPEGTYGLAGNFRRAEILAMARSMGVPSNSPAGSGSC